MTTTDRRAGRRGIAATERMGILEVTGPESTLRALQARLSEDPSAPDISLRMMQTIPADEIIHLNDCTPAELKQLKTMTSAQRMALAKRQAKAREKAGRP